MSGQKKFGAFDGVFTPSILTILGVIMYLRMGWVVGNAGLWGTILIVIIAHIISFSTGLSISSIATDKKVGAGGVYYVLSRSLGLPIGGAIGLTLFVGTALSISLYLVGFSESFNDFLGLDTGINGLRSTGSLFLLALTVIAFISTSVAIKTQFFILAAILLSLVSIFAGGGGPTPNATPPFGGEGVASMETVFAIFFPAVTGFTAGIAMSGDLKNPKKDLPFGTIASISVGFIVYIALAIFLSTKIDQESLLSDYNILSKIALFGPAVIAGVWGATLSSAIGGILGGPRILQAMSLDRITPRLFGKGVGLNNEPRNALLLTVLISEAGILIGELDLIARIVSMFYLAAYGFINISFFLESWASSDFKPSFKVSRWIGLTGFIATFAVMFKLDMLAMIAALVIIGGIFLWLQRKQISLGTGDVWQSVWSTVVKSGLKRMEVAEDHKRNWKPNVILFSGDSEARPHLIAFGKALAGQVGMVTNFDLVENEKAEVLFPKHKQNVSEELLQKHGVFGRRIEVNNVFKGIETIATTFGFSGLDPNTVLMGWARNTQDPIFFTQMTEKLIALDYNVLYLDYDKRWGFRKREQIDMWWRGISNNAELMLHLARFISAAPDWRNANIRVLLVNDFNVDRRIIENRIQMLLDEFRVHAEIKVINNAVERQPFYKLMKTISAEADLVFIGIPQIKPGAEASFVKRTNDLVGIIGTTLLVKASSTFETTQLGLKELEEKPDYQPDKNRELSQLAKTEEQELMQLVKNLDEELGEAVAHFCKSAPNIIQQHYQQWMSDQETLLNDLLDRLEKKPGEGFKDLQDSLSQQIEASRHFQQEELEALEGVLGQAIADYQKRREEILAGMPATIEIKRAEQPGKTMKFPFRQALIDLQNVPAEHPLLKALHRLGAANANLILKFSKDIRELYRRLNQGIASAEPWEDTLKEIKDKWTSALGQWQELLEEIVNLPDYELRQADREICNRLLNQAGQSDFLKAIKKEKNRQKGRSWSAQLEEIGAYGQHWSRNQALFHRNLETNLQLTQLALRLNEKKEQSIARLKEEYVGKILEGIEHLQRTATDISKKMKAEEKELEGIQLYQEEDHDNTEAILWSFMDTARSLGQWAPSAVELMDEKSRNNFQQEQDARVSTITLALSEIALYLVDYHFSNPFQQRLQQLRAQLNQISGSLNNHSSLLNYGLEAVQTDGGDEELSAILEKTEERLNELTEETINIFRTAEAEIKEKYEATESLLNIDSIVIRAEELSQYVRKESRRRGIVAWREWAEKGVRNLQQELSAFISQKQNDIVTASFRRAHEAVRSDQDRLRAYTEALCPDRAFPQLPFYYRQLFTGRHLNLGRKANSRQPEIEQFEKAVRYHQQGLEGGIMITGEPLSGKSYFMEYAARHLLPDPVYRILPPPGGSLAPRALQKAFEQACGQRGTVETLLTQLPENSVFLIEDVELWWLKQKEGHRPISRLIEIIGRFSQRHYFLLSANLEALKLLRTHSAIDRALLSTIILSPMSPKYMQRILWSRHKTGGIPLRIEGKTEQELSDNEWKALVNRLHKNSNGNVGVALRRWLAQISQASEKQFDYHPAPNIPDFPELEDASWYFVLMQLYLHKALSRKRFYRLFEPESKEWMDNRIEELKKSNVLKPHSGEILELHPLVRYRLGYLLKERGLL